MFGSVKVRTTKGASAKRPGRWSTATYWISAVFVGLITRRFIRPEEARLRVGFGPAAEAFMARTRRWI